MLKKSTFKGKLATRGVVLHEGNVELGEGPAHVVGKHLFIEGSKLTLRLVK